MPQVGKKSTLILKREKYNDNRREKGIKDMKESENEKRRE